MYAVCVRNDWGDPFSYARSKEILMAIVMKQQIASTFSGADGFDKHRGREAGRTPEIGGFLRCREISDNYICLQEGSSR